MKRREPRVPRSSSSLLTLAAVSVLVIVVAVAASLVPALRATRVDPIVALRDE